MFLVVVVVCLLLAGIFVVVPRQFCDPVDLDPAGVVDVIAVGRALDDFMVDNPLGVYGSEDGSGVQLYFFLRPDVDVGAIAYSLQLGDVGEETCEDASEDSLVLVTRRLQLEVVEFLVLMVLCALSILVLHLLRR